MVRYFLSLIVLATALLGCGSKEKGCTIGVDPTWFSLNLMGKEANVFAFSDEILYEISRIEGINFSRINRNWDNLILGLEEKKYDAILSSIQPRAYQLEKYSFSNLYLQTGPVIVIRGDSGINVKTSMKGKEIAVSSRQGEALLICYYPEVIVRYYAMIPSVFNQLLSGDVDGVLVDYIPATAFIHDIYKERVKIATPPLNNAGLRLVTMRDQHPDLIATFNRGLKKLREEGVYDKLLRKWDLD